MSTQIIDILFYGWVSLSLGLIIYIYFVFDKDAKSKKQISREYIVDNVSSTVVSYLYKEGKLDADDFLASILDLVYNRYLVLEEIINEDDYILIDTNLNSFPMTPSQEFLRKFLIEEIGDGHRVRFSQVEKYSRAINSAYDFAHGFKVWESKVIGESSRKKLFRKKKSLSHIVLFMQLVLGLLIALFHLIFVSDLFLNFIMLLIIIIMFVVLFLYNFSSMKRTIHGSDIYKGIIELKKYLKRFSHFDIRDLPEITLWEKYLIYAIVLGVANKAERSMQIQLDDARNDIKEIDFSYLNLGTISRKEVITDNLNLITKRIYRNFVNTKKSLK